MRPGRGRRWLQTLTTTIFVVALGIIAAIRAATPASGRSAGDAPGYTTESVVRDLTSPTSFAFGPDGRIYIAEKSGLVRVAVSGTLQAAPFIDLRDEVNDVFDRGLLAIELHPTFPDPPYVYLLHTYDPPDTPLNGRGARVSRLLRVEADRTNLSVAATAAASRTVILGAAGTISAIPDIFRSNLIGFPTCVISGTPIQDCVPADGQTHSIGGLAFGLDQSLYVSMGDASHATDLDSRHMRAQDLDTLSGKVLRIDPLTGAGFADNPFFSGDPNSNRSKVVALGLRNPFRISIHPETGELLIGDVGFSTWEELNIGRGRNFGWPCYEGGPAGSLRYAYVISTTECDGVYALGVGAVQTPALAYGHDYGRAIIAGPVLGSAAYPDALPQEMVVADYDVGWIRLISITGAGSATIRDWLSIPPDLGGITQLRVGPDGLVYYSFLSPDAGGGEIRRIRYGPGPNLAPIVKIQAGPDRGDAPLATTLTSYGTYDPESQPMTYTWSLGNGLVADGPWAAAVYPNVGRFTATLVVSDSMGAATARAIPIYVGSVPTLTILAPTIPATFTPDAPIVFAGVAWDPQDGDLSASIHWTADLYHANHVHLGIFDAVAAAGSFSAPGHDEDIWIRLCAQATDSDALPTIILCMSIFEDHAYGVYLPAITRIP